METIAITDWNDIVSPLYDASCHLLIVKPDGKRTLVDIRAMSLLDRANLCSEHGVTVLICGAISRIAHAILQDQNIKVLSWICGPVNEVITDYQRNADVSQKYAMPGCGRKMCVNNKKFRHRKRGCRIQTKRKPICE
jgi:predicted Fe-Mo cluster-binding NifX family protein